MTCVKYLLFCFNLLFAVRFRATETLLFNINHFIFQVSGIAILTVGAIVHIVYAHYSNFVYQSYQSAPIILIAVGVVIFVVAFFGCCGAVKESHCMIITVRKQHTFTIQSLIACVHFSLPVLRAFINYFRFGNCHRRCGVCATKRGRSYAGNQAEFHHVPVLQK